MVSFELGKEIEKDVFSYGHEGKTKKKILSPHARDNTKNIFLYFCHIIWTIEN